MASSECEAFGPGMARSEVPLVRACGGAPQPGLQQLVDAIIALGYLPTQCKNSSQTEKLLAVRLIKARQACSLSFEQEAALGNLAQGAAKHLVDTIIQLGYLPTQCKNSTVEEKGLAVRLSKARNAGLLSSEQEAALGNLPQRAAGVGHVAGLQAFQRVAGGARAEARIAQAEKLMQRVRDWGRIPRGGAGTVIGKARKEKLFSLEQEAELQALRAEEVMQQVRDFGRCPKETERFSRAERRLAEKLRRARKAELLSPEQEAELQALRQVEMHSRDAACIAEAEGPPNPMEGFAGESQSRIEQDLWMIENGISTKELLRRVAMYKKLVLKASAQHKEFVRRYGERVRRARVSVGKRRYVPSTV